MMSAACALCRENRPRLVVRFASAEWKLFCEFLSGARRTQKRRGSLKEFYIEQLRGTKLPRPFAAADHGYR